MSMQSHAQSHHQQLTRHRHTTKPARPARLEGLDVGQRLGVAIAAGSLLLLVNILLIITSN